ncbi:unnamed protein product [Plutella xylostella]|uniref:(diamondback moth) hypothetical protein n=1 Tax=Plutella xylostella TaxID=51655 RepID=A0A8S4FYY7_PLUXY|nr:unnamed protein product [Plutella xylostella]
MKFVVCVAIFAFLAVQLSSASTVMIMNMTNEARPTVEPTTEVPTRGTFDIKLHGAPAAPVAPNANQTTPSADAAKASTTPDSILKQ